LRVFSSLGARRGAQVSWPCPETVSVRQVQHLERRPRPFRAGPAANARRLQTTGRLETRDPLNGATKAQPPKPLKGAALRHIHA
jgi:hypothetical protein